MTDIRKEQLALLRFEKRLAGLAAALATAGAAAKAADLKLGGGESEAAFADLQNALMLVAQTTGQAHEALNARAVEAGVKMLHASGGVPKSDPPQVVASLLGIG